MVFTTTRSEPTDLLAAHFQVSDAKCVPNFSLAKKSEGFAEVIGPHDSPVVEIVFMPEGAVFCFHHCNNMIVSRYEQQN